MGEKCAICGALAYWEVQTPEDDDYRITVCENHVGTPLAMKTHRTYGFYALA